MTNLSYAPTPRNAGLRAPRSIFLILSGIALVGLIDSCARMPLNVVEPEKFLKDVSNNSFAPAGATIQAQYADLFASRQKQVPMRMLVVADISDDPLYSGIEFQWIGETVDDGAFRAILYGKTRKGEGGTIGTGGTIDQINQPGDTVCASWRSGTILPNERIHFLPLDVRWSRKPALELEASFVDPHGRSWAVRFMDKRDGPPPSAVLAPVAERILNPKSFPFILMRNITLIPWSALEYSLSVDGEERRLAGFPVLMDGKRSSFVRYTNGVTMADLMVSEPAEGTVEIPFALFEDAGGSLSRVEWKCATGDVVLRFGPGLPNLDDVAEVPFKGKWIIGDAEVEAVMAGSVEVAKVGEARRLVFSIDKGWSPAPGSPWMKDFRLEARTEAKKGIWGWSKEWERLGEGTSSESARERQ